MIDITRQISNGKYFLYCTLFKEINEIDEIDTCLEMPSFILLWKMVTSGKEIKFFSCDRTMSYLRKNLVPRSVIGAIFPLVNEKSYPDKQLNNESYAFKIASLESTEGLSTFFVVPDSDKKRIEYLAKKKGYNHSFIIVSPSDYSF